MDFTHFLERHAAAFTPIFDPPLNSNNVVRLDLSASSHEFDGFAGAQLDVAIRDKLKASHALAGVGGYLENRTLYQATELFQDDAERCIHLGVDVFMEPGTALYAPLQGQVQSFANRQMEGDYGPVIILRHCVGDYEFHSLYGHLTIASLAELTPAKSIVGGAKIGEIGPRADNGNWPPHLHFQLIRDMQGFEGDYPGVVRPDQVAFFRQNCPDPTGLLVT